MEKKEAANCPLEVPKQTSCWRNSLASSLNVRPKRYICLPSKLPRSLLFFCSLQLLGKSMFFPYSLHLWNLTSLFCLLQHHLLNKDSGPGWRGGGVGGVTIFFCKEMRETLKKSKLMSLCVRKTFFASLHFLFFTLFFILIIKNI